MISKKYPIKRHQGIFGYDSANKRFNGKPDVCFYITFKIDGRKITEKIGWISEGYTAQLAAELRAKRIRDARHQGEIKTTKDIRAEQRKKNRTLKEIKDHYFNSRGQAIKGRVTDLNRWKNHLQFLETKSVKEIDQFDIESIKRNMNEKQLAPATINDALRLLRRIINHGFEHDLCPLLSFKIKGPKVNNIVTEYLSPEEAGQLVAILDNWPRQDIARMVKLAMFSGMRRGEIFKLKKSHLDFQHSLITIEDPKGGKNASIPISPPVKELLEAQLVFLENEKIRRERRYRNTTREAPLWTELDFVFPGIHGKQRTDCSAINKIKEAAQLPTSFRPFHGLRHHFAVLLASSGEFNLDQIGQLLTHKSSDITRRYAHFMPEAQQRAANRAVEIITGHADTSTLF